MCFSFRNLLVSVATKLGGGEPMSQSVLGAEEGGFVDEFVNLGSKVTFD